MKISTVGSTTDRMDEPDDLTALPKQNENQ